MSVTVYEWHKALQQWGGVWAELVCSGGFNPSLHPQWMHSSLTAHGLVDRTCVALVESAGGQIAILPLLSRKLLLSGLPMRCLDLASNVLSYHAELLASGNVTEALAAALASDRLPRRDVLRLGNLVAGGVTMNALQHLPTQLISGMTSYPGERSPYFALTQDWSAYLAALPKKMRANIKSCMRSTQQAGETGMVWYQQGCDADRLLSDILEVEQKSWKAAENKAIRGDAAEGAYYRNLLPWLANNGLLANVLYVKDRPAAYVLCAQWQGWVGQLKTSFSQDVRDAGFRVIHASIERAFADANREYDFLGDVAPHKLRWADQVRAHQDHWLFATHLRGRGLLSVKRLVDQWRQRRSAQPQTEPEISGEQA